MRTALLLLCVGLASAYKTYEGYHLIDVVPETTEQLTMLHQMYLVDTQIDFWEAPSRLGKNVRMLMDEDYLKHTMTSYLTSHGISYTIQDKDVGESIAREREQLAAQKQVFDLDQFNTLADIETWLNDQLGVCATNGLFCSMSSIGQSIEGREIYLFTISADSATKPVVYIDSTTHAREWLTPATTFKIMNRLLTTYLSDPETAQFLDNYEMQFVGVVNPDGYQYTWDNDRLWRKNRRNTDGACFGVDLNRNFDYKWSWNGVSHVPCSDQYCGTGGGSEPEIQAVMGHLNFIGARTFFLVTLHAYGYDWMHPWGTTTEQGNDNAPCDLAADHDDMFAVAAAAGEALEATYGDRWAWGNSCVVIYTTSGATDDYAKGGAGIKYAYNPELRGNGFVIAPSEIELSYTEVWNALVASEAAVRANPPF